MPRGLTIRLGKDGTGTEVIVVGYERMLTIDEMERAVRADSTVMAFEVSIRMPKDGEPSVVVTAQARPE